MWSEQNDCGKYVRRISDGLTAKAIAAMSYNADDYEETDEMPAAFDDKTYEEHVVRLIRERYSVADELAKVEKRYDAEIKAAGKNERKKKKLEEQKERETAKIKNKYNKRAQSMEIAQAVASTAMAAINAYASASKVNWILGPIAAAMAVAAGAIQIATIQKQHQAQAAGYYSGGFTTRSSDNRREVGVVHANEFVANHQAVANPAIAPVLRLIDQAQRANTIGSLTAADVSNAIGLNREVSARGNAASTGASATINDSAAIIADISARTSKALDRLSDNIEQGILAEVVMDGERGLARKLNHYNKLNQNVRR